MVFYNVFEYIPYFGTNSFYHLFGFLYVVCFAEFDKLPNTVVWGTDVEGKIKQEVWQQMKLTTPSLPVFLICDSFNRVVFVQQGYTINLGEQLIKVIRQL